MHVIQHVDCSSVISHVQDAISPCDLTTVPLKIAQSGCCIAWGSSKSFAMLYSIHFAFVLFCIAIFIQYQIQESTSRSHENHLAVLLFSCSNHCSSFTHSIPKHPLIQTAHSVLVCLAGSTVVLSSIGWNQDSPVRITM